MLPLEKVFSQTWAFGCQLLLVESGGDNLAANYSRELAYYIVYVIDVSVRIIFFGLLPSNQARLVGG